MSRSSPRTAVSRSRPPFTTAPLGSMSAAAFLRSHWQRRARLFRRALPGFAGLHTRANLIALACRDDVESRLLVRARGRWTLAHGPFRRADFRGLPSRDWTLLVQGVNLVDERADALMRRFDFVPTARLDDLMVSYAAPGGGVGPHFDSYDVFLLQGLGRRRWRWGAQRDLALVPDLPVKILADFAPARDEVLGPGDMLYLPPQAAHDGVAVDECTTYSIGFRAPLATEVVTAFLGFLADRVDLRGRYADPGITAPRSTARIAPDMIERYRALIAKLRVTPRDVEAFVGQWLTEPKPHVVFAPPGHPLASGPFARAAARSGIELDLATLALHDTRAVYVNGERYAERGAARSALAALADRRRLDAGACARLPSAALARVHDWYRHGWLHLGR